MANEVLKYNNRMNGISFSKFSSIELDLFFSICFKLKEKEAKEIRISFEEIKKLSNYNRNGTMQEFLIYLKSMYDKLIQLNFSQEDDREYIKFILFTDYRIDKQNKFIDVTLNNKFDFILNKLTSNFTRFELKEFSKLRSVYAKQMFKLLAQYNSTGLYIIDMNDFREKLDIPVKYKMCNIDTKVIKPILLELQFYFRNLKLEKIKKGKNINRLKFTFSPRKEKTLGYKNGEEILADNRSFSDITRENEIREEFEGLDINEQVKLIRKQLLKSNNI